MKLILCVMKRSRAGKKSRFHLVFILIMSSPSIRRKVDSLLVDRDERTKPTYMVSWKGTI